MAARLKRAALYLRVSTDGQTVENQRLALQAVCEQRGWQVVQEYADSGISGAKDRRLRPGLDALLKDATRGRFDVVLAWALDRLGRSLVGSAGHIGRAGSCWSRFGAASAGHRHDDAGGPDVLSGHRCIC